MRFHSIATILRDACADTDLLQLAMALSRHVDAQLSVICMEPCQNLPGLFFTGTQAIAIQHDLRVIDRNSAELETMAREALRLHDKAWEIERVDFHGDSLGDVLAQKLRYQDLIVLPLPYGDRRDSVDVVNFEAGLFEADTAVLAVPDKPGLSGAPGTILVAWDNSAEALAAARAAMPLIVAAKRTFIHVIEPPYHGIDRSDPGGRLAEVFARAGAEVDITVSARQGPNTARQLMAQADKVGAELMVMGGYGHSRLKEAVLGGVTRTMLHEAGMPVLMAR